MPPGTAPLRCLACPVVPRSHDSWADLVAAGLLQPPDRLGVLAATSRGAAESFFASRGVEPALLLDGNQVVGLGRRLPDALRDAGIDVLVVHSAAWRRQTFSYLYVAALATAPVRTRLVVDEERGTVERVSRATTAQALSLAPLEALRGLTRVGGELTRHVAGTAFGHAAGTAFGHAAGRRGPGAPHDLDLREDGDGPWVLSIWRGAPDAPVGGSVTHISGIMSGFRAAGFRTALVSNCTPPPQVTRVVDRFVVTAPASPGARLTSDVDRFTTNAGFRRAGVRVGLEHPPAFVYQRHGFLLAAGVDTARRLTCPLVVEWNGSAVWARNHWNRPIGSAFVRRRLVDPLAASVERRVVTAATLVVAVSERAAEMAVDAGADAERVVVVPNGVDVSRLPDPAAQPGPGGHDARTPSRPGRVLVGWIGSFGPWHGAEVRIRSRLQLPPTVELLLVGDGPERGRCQALASELGVVDRIEWAGTLAHDVALRRLSACDVLVAPHLPLPDTPFFGSPTKIFEYMALGRPIVASRLEQIGEVLLDGSTARLVTPGSVDDLAAGIAWVLTQPDGGRRLGRNAREEAMRRHTWDSRARLVLDRLAVTALSPPGSGPAVPSPLAGVV